MNILIIGGESMVGRSLRMRLEGRHAVCATSRTGQPNVFFDLTSDAESEIEGSFEVIVNCAASFAGNSVAEMLHNEETNAVGAMRVCRLAERVDCRHMVYLSTIFSYDMPENGYFGSYGLSKRHGQENLELFCRRSGIAFTSLLPSQLYDEFGEARKHQPFFYHLLDSAAAGGTVSLHGTKDPLRNFLFVEDLATIIELVIERRVEGIFSCVHPRSYRLSEVVAVAFAAYGHSPRIEFLSEKADIPTVFIPDDDTLYRILGYRPVTDLSNGIMKIRHQQEAGN